ncbi:MAG TPA: site-2 protease family protein, partial [Thermoanaerobaculia bacterium]|nr:site-2 protease family protein [Thermoanaerobaculia bacterium]
VVVSAAGPLSNLFLSVVGLISIVAIKLLVPGSMRDLVDALGGHRFAAGAVAPLAYIFFQFAYVNFSLGIFNLIPIPPLDGSWVLASIFGSGVRRFFQEFGRFGFFVLILLSSTRILGFVMRPFLSFFFAAVRRAIS